MKAEVAGYLQQGYRDVKIKVGRVRGSKPFCYARKGDLAVTWEEDLKRVEAAHGAVGGGVLLVDANAALQPERAVTCAKELREAGASILEEPLPFEKTGALKRLKGAAQDIRLRIMGFETEQAPDNFGRLIDERICDFIQPDVGWCGGITAGRRIVELSEGAGLPVSLHSFGSAIHFAASIQLVASMKAPAPLEDELNPNPLKYGLTLRGFGRDARMNYAAPDGAGLGVEVDWDRAGTLAVDA